MSVATRTRLAQWRASSITLSYFLLVIIIHAVTIKLTLNNNLNNMVEQKETDFKILKKKLYTPLSVRAPLYVFQDLK